MKHFTRMLLTLSMLTALCQGARGQMFATATLDPQGDSLAVLKIKARLDSVRRSERRDIVAVVLSGGGAKGAAELGVLKYMEDLRIPVDFVCGTSIGGLLGGMYCMGYKADYLDSLVRSINWDIALTDRIPEAYIPYKERRARERFMISVPFGSLDPAGDLAKGDLGPSLLGSLPAGIYSGLNVSNILNSISVGYQDSLSFADLPIPFMCVASDLVSCKAKYWFEGSLVEALRSTMSVPVLFAPVRTDGMVLVDGGLRNNFPSDVAKAVGADIIIGIDLGDEDLTYDQIRNMANVLPPMIDMMSKEVLEANLAIPDLIIKPDVTGYNMMSFGDEPMKVLYANGRIAAEQNDGALRAILQRTGPSVKDPEASAIDINQTPVTISEVLFEGVSPEEGEYLSTLLDLPLGTPVKRRALERGISQMFSTGAFKTISYRLEGSHEPYTLVYECIKSPSNEIRVGARVDNVELSSVLLDIGIDTRQLSGGQLELSAKIGQNRWFAAHYAYNAPHFPTINLDFNSAKAQGDVISEHGGNGMLGFIQTTEQLYLSNIRLRRYDGRIGLRNDYFRIKRFLFPDGRTLPEGSPSSYDNLSLFGSARFNNLDNAYFAHKGLSLGLDYQWIFATPGRKERENAHVLYGTLRKAFPLGVLYTLQLSARARYVINREDDLSLSNIIGGMIEGRYVEQQMPFCGFDDATVADDFLTSAELTLRRKIMRRHYLSLSAGAFASAADPLSFSSRTDIYTGASLDYGYDTVLGPVRAGIHWSSFTRKTGFHISLGYDF